MARSLLILFTSYVGLMTSTWQQAVTIYLAGWVVTTIVLIELVVLRGARPRDVPNGWGKVCRAAVLCIAWPNLLPLAAVIAIAWALRVDLLTPLMRLLQSMEKGTSDER